MPEFFVPLAFVQGLAAYPGATLTIWYNCWQLDNGKTIIFPAGTTRDGGCGQYDSYIPYE